MDDYKIKIGFQTDKSALTKSAKETQGIFATILKDFKSQLPLQIGRGIAQMTIAGLKDMVQNVMELDKAQTELKKVSDLSGESLRKFTERAFEVGERTAKTGTQIVQAST